MADQPQTGFTADALAQLTEAVSQANAQNLPAAVSAEFDRRAEAARQEEARRHAARAAAATNNAMAADPVASTVMPVVKPWMDALALRSANDVDNAKFYARHQDAIAYEPHVEKIVTDALAAGRPIDRDSAWKYFQGANPDHFYEKRKKAEEEAALRAANGGMTFGPPGAPRPDWAPITFDDTTSLEDMRKALAGKTF